MKRKTGISAAVVISLVLAYPLFSFSAIGGQGRDVQEMRAEYPAVTDIRIPVFGRKDRVKQGKPALSAPADRVRGLSAVQDAASAIVFSARVLITGNEPHTKAMLTDTVSGKNYLVVPEETEKRLYDYQGYDLQVTGRLLETGALTGPFPADGIVNPDGWTVETN